MEEFCHRCHCKLNPKNKVQIRYKNIYVCKKCAEEKYSKCEICHQYACEEDLVYTDTKPVCISCLCEKYVLCPHCETFIKAAAAIDFHGHLMCRKCKAEYFGTCGGCNRKVEKEELEEVRLNRKTLSLCPDCLNGKYIFCEECRDWKPAEKSCRWNGHVYCAECAEFHCKPCDSCKKLVAENKIEYLTVKGRSLEVCPDCLRSKYCECDFCYEFFPKNEIYTIDSEHYCAECLREAAAEWDEEQRLEALETLGAVALGIWAGKKLHDALFSPAPSDDKPLFSEGDPENENEEF